MIFREVEDRDLILSARRGNVDAFNVLVSRWEKRVYNYLLRILGNREDALDLCQETFLKAYRSLGRLDDPTRFASWIFRIAHNEAVSLCRRKQPIAMDEVPEQSHGHSLSAGGSASYPAETAVAVQAALEGLTPDQREVVVLKVYQGFKFHEIAEILGIPASTIKSRLYTAMDALKESLAPLPARG